MNQQTLLTIFLCGHLFSLPAHAEMSIVNSKHNLSSSGPGEVRALTEDRICIFCHTPHNAMPYTPLWNKDLKAQNYTLYQSSTLSASPQQPSGPTRLCLSCHDGTIALGDVLRPVEGIQMSMEITAARRSYLSTDISDDHPVSFNYYDSLPDPALASTVPMGLRTYAGGNIHCTTCHDPHDDSFGKFLVMDNLYSALCTTCHVNIAGWTGSSHATSTAVWINDGSSKSVAEHGCESCHTTHGAGGPQRLLRELEEEKNCTSCHDGTVATTDIASQFSKMSHHPIEATTIGVTNSAHDPAEDVSFLQNHVECVDCHNPHAARGEEPSFSYMASGSLSQIAGKAADNSIITPIVYEYELCFKCHGDSSNSTPIITRYINENNTRLEFATTNPSYHPVISMGRNDDVPSLPSTDEPDLTTTSIISCVDCHDSDNSSALNGTGPRGPHGSIYRPILRQRYDTFDNMPESELSYALCYRCHDRTKLLDDTGAYNTTSSHKQHVVDQRAPCSACHDPHGVQNIGPGSHTHLINFDTAIVSGPASGGPPYFTDNGSRQGSCTLICHGITHTAATHSY